ncbi:MAG TPA: LTA synthase family protein [Leeuwenhoekiella sp.]|nr:LTA synthase family protein [Leeuwenhoekiella sp.]
MSKGVSTSKKINIELKDKLHLLLISYFNTSLVLLGSDLFGYSIEDIEQTVGASGSLSFSSILIFLLVLTPLLIGLYFLPKKVIVPKFVAILLPLVSLILFFIPVSKSLTVPNLESDFANSIVTNKSAHFYREAESYFFDAGYDVDIYAGNYLVGTGSLDNLAGNTSRNYTDPAFPFLHKTEKKDVLSPFFEPKSKAPNIVFILVEGLGRAFTNEGAYLGNFTPFLDSLSQKSLYWKNFLSNGGRTFAVLPSLLGSLPFAENGFLALKDKMPKELSLLNLLENYGYETSFFYGGDSSFDAMNGYLQKNGTNNIYDETTFPSRYKKLPARTNFSWGYGDQELYDFYLKKQKEDTLAPPRLDILLTLTTHSPFLVPESDKYDRMFEKRMNDIGFKVAEKNTHKNYKDQYATILYADEALKNLFEKYKQRADFDNTIFVITGDHRIPEIPMSTKIDRYHVPFIIYSPLLKRSAEIASISSHFDVAPSLLNYLNTNYDLKMPEETTFVGGGLDTVRAFRNIHQIPLKQTKTDLVDFVMDTYHLNKDDLLEIDRNMGENLIDNPDKKAQLKAAFQAFKRRNSEFIDGTALIPDSIYTQFSIKN